MNVKANSPLFEYCLRLGDTPLILGQRLSEWCGHGPILEEDIALTNISLDLIGQARAFLSYAAEVQGANLTEDDLAFLRGEREFKNNLLVEQPNGDFGQTILRQFLVSTFQYYYYDALAKSKDETIAALAQKSLKEVTYHLRHSSEWIIRLGDGTAESKKRVEDAIANLWRFTGDMFDMDEVDAELISKGIAIDLNTLRKPWLEKVSDTFRLATLSIPENVFMMSGSRNGKHTEHLGHMLSEMQYLPRTHPGASW
ncbi:MAG: phenylacetate-CoA oxygenase subunit PaaC [Bacteroidia bacterium]|nr:phenylacetate-CoA oxygenase subunit PaaC [Bacteroidia bacterium]